MNNWIYITVMLLTTLLIRELPMVLFRKPIKNKYLRSFLYYIPYVTLSVMTFPAILHVTGNAFIGAAALLLGIVLAWFGAGMFPVAVICCIVVFVLNII